MQKQFTAEENYDRLNAITSEMNESVDVETWGTTGIIVKPAFGGFASVTMRRLSKEFLNFFLEKEGLVLDGINEYDYHI